MLAVTKRLSRQNVRRDKTFAAQTRVCRDKHTFVVTKDVLVATKMIFGLVPASDSGALVKGSPQCPEGMN